MQERGFWILRNDATGEYDFEHAAFDARNRTIKFGPVPNREGWTVVGTVHTHPFVSGHPGPSTRAMGTTPHEKRYNDETMAREFGERGAAPLWVIGWDKYVYEMDATGSVEQIGTWKDFDLHDYWKPR